MIRPSFRLLALSLILAISACSSNTISERSSPPATSNTYFFEQNIGQLDDPVSYLLHEKQRQVFFTPTEVVYLYTASKEKPGLVIRQSFPDLPPTTPQGTVPAGTQLSRFIGNDHDKWEKDIPTFHALTYGEKSLQFRLYNNQLMISASEPVTLQFAGNNDLRIDEQGSVILETDIGLIPMPHLEGLKAKKINEHQLLLSPTEDLQK